MVTDQEQLMDKVFLMIEYLNKRVNYHLGDCAGRFQTLLEYIQGKALESKLSEVRAPSIYLQHETSDMIVTDNSGSNLYKREINYCLNCGTEVTTIEKPYEIACCPFFKNAVTNNSIHVTIDPTGLDLHRYYLNVTSRKVYLKCVNKELDGNMGEFTIHWCPYCGVKIPDEFGVT
jgi:DNA-directed RNA polymerase subunit RPC12/RpoP